MKLAGSYLSLILVAAFLGCTGSDPVGASSDRPGGDGGKADSPPGGGDGAAGGPLVIGDVSLSASPAGKVTATLTIERNGLAGVVHVTALDAPSGVRVEPLDIPEATSVGEIAVGATTNVAPVRTRVTLQAEVGDAKVTRSVNLVVRGLPGSVDTTTSPTGIFTTPLQTDSAVAIAGDERNLFLVDYNCTVSRHLGTGEVDPAFRATSLKDGPQFAGFSAGRGCSQIALRGETVVVAGSGILSGTNSDFRAALVRLDRDGTVDPGSAYVPTSTVVTRPSGMALDESGTVRVVLAATDATNGVHEVHLVDAKGKLLNVAPGSLTLRSDGPVQWAFLADGSARTLDAGSRLFSAAGFKPDGSIDELFGSTGVVAKPAGTIGDYFTTNDPRTSYDVAADAAGRLVAVATYPGSAPMPPSAFVARYTPMGGAWEEPLVPSVRPSSAGIYSRVAVDARTGAILAAGIANGSLFVSRFTNAGQPDVSFGTNGTATFPLGVRRAVGIHLQPDGAYVLLETNTSGVNLIRFWL